jgi:hypothetical protein
MRRLLAKIILVEGDVFFLLINSLTSLADVSVSRNEISQENIICARLSIYLFFPEITSNVRSTATLLSDNTIGECFDLCNKTFLNNRNRQIISVRTVPLQTWAKQGCVALRLRIVGHAANCFNTVLAKVLTKQPLLQVHSRDPKPAAN